MWKYSIDFFLVRYLHESKHQMKSGSQRALEDWVLDHKDIIVIRGRTWILGYFTVLTETCKSSPAGSRRCFCKKILARKILKSKIHLFWKCSAGEYYRDTSISKILFVWSHRNSGALKNCVFGERAERQENFPSLSQKNFLTWIEMGEESLLYWSLLHNNQMFKNWRTDLNASQQGSAKRKYIWNREFHFTKSPYVKAWAL